MRYPEVVEHMAQGQVADWQMVDHCGVYIDHHISFHRLTSSIQSFSGRPLAVAVYFLLTAAFPSTDPYSIAGISSSTFILFE
jgi:hypothetical protein